jgi:hypothetical protein
MKTRQARYLWLWATLMGVMALAAVWLTTACAPAPTQALPAQAADVKLPGPALNSAPQGNALSVTAATTTTLYFPLIFSPSTLGISSIEVTQATQNSASPVPLVANRRAEVRVYVYSLTGQPISNVRVSLSASRGGVTLSPTLVIPPQTAPVTPLQSDLSTTFNVELPSSWLSNTVSLTALAYQGTTPGGNGPNNPATTTLTFNAVPPLNVMVVPIQYFDTVTNHTYAAPLSSTATTLEVSDWITRAYPISSVNVTYYKSGQPYYPFSGNLRNLSDWNTLLGDMETLKIADTNPGGWVYFALIPTTDRVSGTAWFSSGYSGYSYVGYRAGTGLELPTSQGWDVDQTGRNAAHEIGHTLGRNHSPSGNPLGVDRNYPYSNGSIGQFGLDIPKWHLWNPANTYDLMGYCPLPLTWVTSCASQWVSDYTYSGLYANQVAVGAAGVNALAPGLLIRANLDSAAQPTLQPVYAFTAPLTDLPATSDYQVQLLDAGGQVVATYPVPVLEADSDSLGAAGPDVTLHSIHAFVPSPAQGVAGVRLVHTGQTAALKALSAPTGVSAAAAPTVTRTGNQLTLRWGAATTPALVRYTADNGQTWTTLGVDVTGGELQLDAASLPAGVGRFDVTLGDAPSGTTLSVTP